MMAFGACMSTAKYEMSLLISNPQCRRERESVESKVAGHVMMTPRRRGGEVRAVKTGLDRTRKAGAETKKRSGSAGCARQGKIGTDSPRRRHLATKTHAMLIPPFILALGSSNWTTPLNKSPSMQPNSNKVNPISNRRDRAKAGKQRHRQVPTLRKLGRNVALGCSYRTKLSMPVFENVIFRFLLMALCSHDRM